MIKDPRAAHPLVVTTTSSGSINIWDFAASEVDADQCLLATASIPGEASRVTCLSVCAKLMANEHKKKGGENDAGAKVEFEFEKRGGLAIPAAAAAKGVFTRGGGTSTSKKKAKKAKSG